MFREPMLPKHRKKNNFKKKKKKTCQKPWFSKLVAGVAGRVVSETIVFMFLIGFCGVSGSWAKPLSPVGYTVKV